MKDNDSKLIWETYLMEEGDRRPQYARATDKEEELKEGGVPGHMSPEDKAADIASRTVPPKEEIDKGYWSKPKYARVTDTKLKDGGYMIELLDEVPPDKQSKRVELVEKPYEMTNTIFLIKTVETLGVGDIIKFSGYFGWPTYSSSDE